MKWQAALLMELIKSKYLEQWFPNLLCSEAPDQCVKYSMAPSMPVNVLDLMTIYQLLYVQEITYKIQYNLNSVFKLFHGQPESIPWAPTLGTTDLECKSNTKNEGFALAKTHFS